ncbi:ribonuclease P protein subunit p40-like [Xenia sp. Carnegie-2017]|uniref:ribonuclease P protein subunit p40-like n=1 Tax=Xenia sp. Carnegie-2017 TaxID=2897299 RepID=UPI001F03F4EA|nr:ribonuclease P protein subunit p40-like [Xenia sp. Carnegie-2017]
MTFEKFFGKEDENKFLKRILDHHFNFSIGLLVPTLSKQKFVNQISESSLFSESCCLAVTTLLEIINPKFLSQFLRRGVVSALSYKTKIDTEDCVALLPTGIIWLSLTKDTYECLGLQGKPSPFKNNPKFDVVIDVNESYFEPSKKFYQRVLKAFQKTGLKFEFLFSERSIDDKSEYGEKLQSYLKSRGIISQPFHCEHYVENFNNIDVPTISFHDESFFDISATCNYLEFHEWLGCVLCNVDCSQSSPDSYLNTLSSPEPNSCQQVVLSTWIGFISSHSVQNVLKFARDLLKKNPDIPWLNVTIWGFSDSPVTWRDLRHGFYLNGDNHYSIILFQDHCMWMYRTLSDHDEQL